MLRTPKFTSHSVPSFDLLAPPAPALGAGKDSPVAATSDAARVSRTEKQPAAPTPRTRLGSGPGEVRLLYTDFGSVAQRQKVAAERRGKADIEPSTLPPPPTVDAPPPPAVVAGPEVGLEAEFPRRAAWPRPCTTAFQGVVGEIADLTTRYTEADPHGVIVALLVGVGNEVGRSAHSVLGGKAHWPNLFAAIVGNTARGRKGTATGVALNILGRATTESANRRVHNGLSTGEGIIARIRDGSIREVRKIVNGQHKVTITEEPGVRDKRLLLIESEGGRTFSRLRNSTGTLGPVLSAAFDGENLTVATRHHPLAASKPHVSVLINVTREVLAKRFPEIEIESGLANRFLWTVVDRPRIDPDAGAIPDADLARCAASVGAAIAAASNLGEVPLDAGAAMRWLQEYDRLERDVPGRHGRVTTRAAVLVRRLALVYAILGQSRVVTTDHLEAALDLWRYCDESARLLFGAELGNSKARRIYDALLENPEGMSQEEIRERVFSKHLRSDDLHDALQELLTFRLIEIARKPTAGRPATIVRPVLRHDANEDVYEFAS